MATDFDKIKDTVENKIRLKFIGMDNNDLPARMAKDIQLYALEVVIDVLKEYESSRDHDK